MPIHAKTNLYPGVNAHLNSFLQQPRGNWTSFHHGHIEHLRDAIEQALPQNYYADSERSLQIRGQGLWNDLDVNIQPDVTIFGTGTASPSGARAAQAMPESTLTLSLWDTLENDDDYLTSIVVYQVDAGFPPGKPLTRIEVLSPANKPGSSYHRAYMYKRAEALRSGIALVEIDYLDQTKPLLPQIPSYRDGVIGAYPYMVLIANPHEPVEERTLRIDRFGVTEALPIVSIPVAGIEDISLDLGAVYNRTIESRRAWINAVDYATDPVDFDRYHPDDQARIRALLEAIRRERGEGA
jgi:hypothetical protein